MFLNTIAGFGGTIAAAEMIIELEERLIGLMMLETAVEFLTDNRPRRRFNSLAP